jgi:pimeloyl-ACP methyl ester carboxylesterase
LGLGEARLGKFVAECNRPDSIVRIDPMTNRHFPNECRSRHIAPNGEGVAMVEISRRESVGLAAVGAGLALCAPVTAAAAGANAAAGPSSVRHRNVEVDGIRMFYREAGDPKLPTLMLLHGFPSSSHMFRHLLPALADRFHLVAPDYPGFGFSDFPPRDRFDYSFAGYAGLIGRFADALGLDRFGLYLQDYGAPIGLRLALSRPESIAFLIVQNGNAYAEGLSPGWDPLKAYWREPSPANREQLKGWLGPDGTRLQYAAGLRDDQLTLLSPELWTLDWALLSRPGNIDLQLDLFGDYAGNVALYPEFQAYFRSRRPSTLIAWGQNDPFFTIAGARAFLRDLPSAELHLLDGSHFLLETHGPEVASLIRNFARKLA